MNITSTEGNYTSREEEIAIASLGRPRSIIFEDLVHPGPANATTDDEYKL